MNQSSAINSNTDLSFADFAAECRHRLESHLKAYFSSDHLALTAAKTSNAPINGDSTVATQLSAAMQYSLLNGGKRVRPILVYASAKSVQSDQFMHQSGNLDLIASAVETLHVYSLIHDDLPAMDDDDLRRGKPSCHKAFDEATAILAGDALQTLAFELLTQTQLPATTQIALVKQLAKASGAEGMVLGQAIDLASVDHEISLAQLEHMHRHKTGALIRASVAMGAMALGASTQQLTALDQYAAATGLAFQVQDDILDVVSDTATLGKQQGADIARNKPTYVALLGLEGARNKLQLLYQESIDSLSTFDSNAHYLRELARYIVERNH